MARLTTIGELAKSPGFKGTPQNKLAEPDGVRTIPVIDNTLPVGKNMRTSIDCYVSGQYIQPNGKVIEVRQRYTIFVGYHRETQAQTMAEVRNRIISDFDARYGGTFNVSTVHVPDIPAAPVAAGPEDEQLYQGSGLWRREVMPPYEKERFDIATEKIKAATNIKNLRDRYRFRR